MSWDSSKQLYTGVDRAANTFVCFLTPISAIYYQYIYFCGATECNIFESGPVFLFAKEAEHLCFTAIYALICMCPTSMFAVYPHNILGPGSCSCMTRGSENSKSHAGHSVLHYWNRAGPNKN